MTGLAIAVAYQMGRFGVDLRQEMHDIVWSTARPIKLISQTYEPKTIALTFDDGPHGDKTSALLRLLSQLNVKATFFVVGKMVVKYPELVRQELAAGHEVGNHTFDHLNLDKLTGPQVSLEYRNCSDAIQNATGQRPTFCRPPGGRFDTEVLNAASQEGMWTVLWTDDPGDFARPDPKVLVERLDSQLKDGGILLLHDGIPQTMQVLPAVISDLRKRGYRFVTCSQLLEQRNHAARLLARRTPAIPKASLLPLARKPKA